MNTKTQRAAICTFLFFKNITTLRENTLFSSLARSDWRNSFETPLVGGTYKALSFIADQHHLASWSDQDCWICPLLNSEHGKAWSNLSIWADIASYHQSDVKDSGSWTNRISFKALENCSYQTEAKSVTLSLYTPCCLSAPEPYSSERS